MIDKIKKECADFKHIQWLAGHIDFYQANEKGSMVLKELEKYGCNVYTYPHEAKKAYQNFTNELCNNPYNYMSGFQSIYEKWGIYASVLDGYLLSIDSDIKIPIGFLKEIINSEAGENIENVQQKAATMLNDCLNHYKKECYNPFCKKLSDGKRKYEEKCSAVQLKVAESEITKHIILYLIFFIISIVWYLRFPAKAVRLTIGVLFLLSIKFLIDIINEIRCKKRYHDTQKLLKVIDTYIQEYAETNAKVFTTEYLINQENGRIQKVWEQRQYDEMLTAVSEEKIEKIKPITAGNLMIGKWIPRGILALILVPTIFSLVTNISTMRLSMPSLGEWLAEIGTVQDSEKKEKMENTTEEEIKRTSSFEETGLIFSDSDIRELTEEEIYELKDIEEYDFKTLLGFARNEMYARKGYAFKKEGIYYPHYMKYSWYSEMEHRNVTNDMFSEIERKNIDLIISIEEREGFR